MKIAIFGSGTVRENIIIRRILREADFFIAADGGVNHMEELGILPNIIMGDRDSTIVDIKDTPHIDYPSRKDTTDSEIALRYAIKKNPKEISLIGFTGTRLDHTLNNITLLRLPHKKNIPCKIYDENNIIMMCEGEFNFNKRDYDYFKYFSLIPLSEGIIVSLKGFSYELKDYKLSLKEYTGLCISNEMKEEELSVRIMGGSVLIIFSND